MAGEQFIPMDGIDEFAPRELCRGCNNPDGEVMEICEDCAWEFQDQLDVG